MMGRILTIGAYAAALISVTIALIMSGVPRKYGVYRWIANNYPDDRFKGMTPSFLHGTNPGYTYDLLSAEASLTGRTAIVTGANSGMGFIISLHLAKQGADVIMACRNPKKCMRASFSITNTLITSRSNSPMTSKSNYGSVEPMTLDTSSIASVRSFANRYASENPGALDILVLNAGVAMAEENAVSSDGIELLFATNHVGHQLIYDILLPQLLESGGNGGMGARVVLTSSMASYQAPPWGVGLTKDQVFAAGGFQYSYAQSKLAQILFAQEATRRLDLMGNAAALNVYVNAFHPGLVKTNIMQTVLEVLGDDVWGRFISKMHTLLETHLSAYLFSAEEGALTGLFLAAAPRVKTEGIRGKYFHPQAMEVVPSEHAKNFTLQVALWDFTEELVQ